jgi:riboflavin-specific deaminase-like protein
MRLLHPEPRDTTPEELASGLGLGDLAPPDRPYLALNMVSTLDGRATFEGRTAGMSTELDRRLFHQLRTQVDAVMVGAGTLRIERYGRMAKTAELRSRRVAEGLAPDPLAVVVSASLGLPPDLPLLGEPEQRIVIATASDGELADAEAQVDYLRCGEDLSVTMVRLRGDYGVRSVLCEGGPTLNSHLLAAGLVDELFLTLNPKLVGGGEAFTIVAGRMLPEPAELELVWVAEGDGDLFTRWRVQKPLHLRN